MTDMQIINSDDFIKSSFDAGLDFSNALQDTKHEISETLSASKDDINNTKDIYDAGWNIKRDNLFNILTPSSLYVEMNQETSQRNQTSSLIVNERARKNDVAINSITSSTSKQEVSEIIGKLLTDSNEMIAVARENVRSANTNLSAAELLVEKLDESWVFSTSDVERDNVDAIKKSVVDAELVLKEANEDFISIMELKKVFEEGFSSD